MIKNMIYDYIKLIPFGKVTTFKEIAKACGNIKYSRTVGKVLNSFNISEDIPLHRVVNSRGELNVKYVFGGIKEQKSKLIQEGILVKKNKVDLVKYGFYFW